MFRLKYLIRSRLARISSLPKKRVGTFLGTLLAIPIISYGLYDTYDEYKYDTMKSQIDTTSPDYEKLFFSLSKKRKILYYNSGRWNYTATPAMWKYIFQTVGVEDGWFQRCKQRDYLLFPSEPSFKMIIGFVDEFPKIIEELPIEFLTTKNLLDAHNANINLSAEKVIKLLQDNPDIYDKDRYVKYPQVFYLMSKECREMKKNEFISDYYDKTIQTENEDKGSLLFNMLRDYAMSGEDLSDIINKTGNSDIKFYKYLNHKKQKYGYSYQRGLNQDTNPFDPICDCCPGGLYFTYEANKYKYREYGPILASVSIINSPDVFYKSEGDKIKGTSILMSYW